MIVVVVVDLFCYLDSCIHVLAIDGFVLNHLLVLEWRRLNTFLLLTMSTRPQDDRNQEATVYLVGLA